MENPTLDKPKFPSMDEMTLEDHFAAHILAGMLAGGTIRFAKEGEEKEFLDYTKGLTRHAYLLAQAMVITRAEHQKVRDEEWSKAQQARADEEGTE